MSSPTGSDASSNPPSPVSETDSGYVSDGSTSTSSTTSKPSSNEIAVSPSGWIKSPGSFQDAQGWGSLDAPRPWRKGAQKRYHGSIRRSANKFTKALMLYRHKSSTSQETTTQGFCTIMETCHTRPHSSQRERNLMTQMYKTMNSLSYHHSDAQLKLVTRQMNRLYSIIHKLVKTRVTLEVNGFYWPWDLHYTPGLHQEGYVNFNEMCRPVDPLRRYFQKDSSHRVQGTDERDRSAWYEQQNEAKAESGGKAGNKTRVSSGTDGHSHSENDKLQAATSEDTSISERNESIDTGSERHASGSKISVHDSLDQGTDITTTTCEDEEMADASHVSGDSGVQLRMYEDGACTLCVSYSGGIHEMPFQPGSDLRKFLVELAEQGEDLGVLHSEFEQFARKHDLSSNIEANKEIAVPGRHIVAFHITATDRKGPDPNKPKESSLNFFAIPGGMLYIKLRRGVVLSQEGFKVKVFWMYTHDDKPFEELSKKTRQSQIQVLNIEEVQKFQFEKFVYAVGAKVKRNCAIAKDYDNLDMAMPMFAVRGSLHERSWDLIEREHGHVAKRTFKNVKQKAREELARNKMSQTGITALLEKAPMLGKHTVMPGGGYDEELDG